MIFDIVINPELDDWGNNKFDTKNILKKLMTGDYQGTEILFYIRMCISLILKIMYIQTLIMDRAADVILCWGFPDAVMNYQVSLR